MTDKELLGRITVRTDVFGGKPIVRDMRISVELVLGLLARGEPQEAILDDYPDLEPDDIRACIAYAHAVIARDTLDAVSSPPGHGVGAHGRAPLGPQPHRRRSIRLQHHDYGEGVYFVTICAAGYECLFGEIVDFEMQRSPAGSIVAEEWLRTPSIRPEVELDAFVVMPNHFHGVVLLLESDGGAGRHDAGLTRRPRSLGSLAAGFKSAVTKRINELRGTPRKTVWQRSYHEHIIRDEDDLVRIRKYVEDNPARWAEDRYNPLARDDGRTAMSAWGTGTG